jgi:dipeptidyl aminopeptidase/acylaminoacyl peptidase
LGRTGIAVLRMDDRGFGGSGGDAATATSRDLAEDIEAGLAWLRDRPDIDAGRLGLLGHSEGGLIGPMIAAEDTALRVLVILAGPSRTGREIIAFQQRYAIEHSPLIRPEARDSALAEARATLDSMAARQPWIRFFLDHDPHPPARRVRAATLILHGATDMQVTVDQAEELAAAIREGGNPDVTVHVFPETNHLFQHDPSGNPAGYAALPGEIRPEVIAVLTAWLAEKL